MISNAFRERFIEEATSASAYTIWLEQNLHELEEMCIGFDESMQVKIKKVRGKLNDAKQIVELGLNTAGPQKYAEAKAVLEEMTVALGILLQVGGEFENKVIKNLP